MTTLAEGTLFSNRYRIMRCIGVGGMGAVYEVEHVETERRRALKVMHPHVLANQDMRNRFQKEAKVAAYVDSEHIVDVFDAGIDESTGTPFLVMELLRGEELGKRLTAVGRFTPQDVVTYLHQTALALDKSHASHIVHRDLKPENLFLTIRENGQPHIKVLDFGIAKFIVEGNAGANATRSIGTPIYMAPEQFLPGGTVSPKTDIYALGLMAFTFLVGKPYWEEESHTHSNIFAFAAIAMHGPKEAATTRASRLGAPLPASFDAWFAQATDVNPEKRFSSATEAILTLADALAVARPAFSASSSGPHDTLPLAAQPATTPSSTSGGLASTNPPANRSRNIVASVFGLVALLGIGVAIAMFVSAKDQRSVPATPAATQQSAVVETISSTIPVGSTTFDEQTIDTNIVDAGDDADAADADASLESDANAPAASASAMPTSTPVPTIVRKTPKSKDHLYTRD